MEVDVGFGLSFGLYGYGNAQVVRAIVALLHINIHIYNPKHNFPIYIYMNLYV